MGEAWGRDKGGIGLSTSGKRERKFTLNWFMYKHVQNFGIKGEIN